MQAVWIERTSGQAYAPAIRAAWAAAWRGIKQLKKAFATESTEATEIHDLGCSGDTPPSSAYDKLVNSCPPL